MEETLDDQVMVFLRTLRKAPRHYISRLDLAECSLSTKMKPCSFSSFSLDSIANKVRVVANGQLLGEKEYQREEEENTRTMTHEAK